MKRYEYTVVEVPRGSPEAREHLVGEMLNKVATISPETVTSVG